MATAGACVWLTGQRGAGKSTVARAVADELRRRGRAAIVLDDPDAREHLRADDPIASVAWLAGVLADCGVVAVVALDAPARAMRDRARGAIGPFVEVFVDNGGRGDASGYEEPFAAELRVPTHDRDATASAAQVISWLERRGLMPHDPPHPSEERGA
jgi:adenylylsulfate kinase